MNVVAGLMAAGELHICLVDSSDVGASFELQGRFQRSVIRAGELAPIRRALDSFRSGPIMAYTSEADLKSRIVSTVAEQDWDVVWFSRARVHRLCADLFTGIHILDLDDLNNQLLTTLNADRRARLGFWRSLPRNILNSLLAKRWEQYYQRLGPVVDTMVVCHEGDRKLLPACNTAVVRNGYPKPSSEPALRTSGYNMLFVGPLTYEPNYLAVRWFIDEVLDRIRAVVPEATLSVVGDLAGLRDSLEHEAVTLHGFVPDVEPYYEAAVLAVAPLHSGGGTRIKILEAMARSCPMVSTPFACEGLSTEPGTDLCVAATAEDFAEHCIRLLTDGDVAQAMAGQALASFLNDYTAAHSSQAVTALVEQVTDVTPPKAEASDSR